MAKTHIASDETLALLVDAFGNGIELDGTPEGYRAAMRKWFRARDCNSLDSEGLTALVDEWYELVRPVWCGGTTFYQPDVSAVTYGTKIGDNADMVLEPATDSDEGTDDYAGNPLFASIDCNWMVDADTLEPMITAIEDVTDGFVRTDTDTFVGVLHMSGWTWHTETDTTYTWGYSAHRPVWVQECEPLRESVRVDGTIRGWVVHAKYNAALVDSKLTCCKGVVPRGWFSHNTVHTYARNHGTQYSGTCACEDYYLKLMTYICLGSLTLDGIMQGCSVNNYQYPAQVTEEGVARVLIDSSHSLEVGMGVLIGDYTSSGSDRAYLYSTTGYDGATITAIESETVDDVEYAAVYVDVDSTFDVTANGSATEGTTYISTYSWPTGTTDCVLGDWGSPTSNTSGKYPCKLAGIEIMVGQYEIISDSILSLFADDYGDYWYEPYVCDLSANQSTSITSNYTASGAGCIQPSSEGWAYIKKLSWENGVAFPIEMGGSSSTYTRDAFYRNTASTGTREWLSRGCLSHGVAVAGLSCVNGHHAVSAPYWSCGARLSACGNRGEWAA